MSGLWQRLNQWWQTLGDRDRATLTWAAPIILVLVLYLALLQPVVSHYLSVREQRQVLADNLVWLYENAPLVERMTNACARERLPDSGGPDLASYAKTLGQRAGGNVQVRVINTRELDIELENIDGRRALALIQTYVCAGFKVADIQLERRDSESAQARLSARLAATAALGAGT